MSPFIDNMSLQGGKLNYFFRQILNDIFTSIDREMSILKVIL